MALDLPFSPESAGVAPQQLVAWMCATSVPRNETSELMPVSSSVSSSATPCGMPDPSPTAPCACWKSRDQGVDIAVTDGGALTTPERVDAGVSDLAGRGLSIVETLASRWWVEHTRSRTTVHALVALA